MIPDGSLIGRCGGCGDLIPIYDVIEEGMYAGGHESVQVVRYTETGSAHAPECYGDCNKWGCPYPVPIPVEYEAPMPCGPVVFNREEVVHG